MKTNIHPNHHKTIHQHIEGVLRHKVMVMIVLAAMFMAVVNTDVRFRELMRTVYSEGMGFMTTHFTHEHPSHQHTTMTIARMPTVSGQ
jgi:hypothetical protein